MGFQTQNGVCGSLGSDWGVLTPDSDWGVGLWNHIGVCRTPYSDWCIRDSGLSLGFVRLLNQIRPCGTPESDWVVGVSKLRLGCGGLRAQIGVCWTPSSDKGLWDSGFRLGCVGVRTQIGVFGTLDLDAYVCTDLSVDFVRVLLVDDLLDGGGHQDVALLVEHVLALVRLRAGEAHDRAVLDPVVFERL